MNLDAGDTLVAVKRIPKIDGAAEGNGDEEADPQSSDGESTINHLAGTPAQRAANVTK